MKIAPLTNDVAVLIHEDTEYVFTPAFKPKTEVIKQQQQEEEQEELNWNRYWQHRCLDIRLKIKFCFCFFVFVLIIAIIVFFVACGHDLCPGTGMRGFVKRPPPSY
jgi:hypothetical protein